MCLGIPMKVTKIEADRAIVETDGLEVDVSLALIEAPKLGDFVLIHAGFAIEKLDKEEAVETLEMIRELLAHPDMKDV